MDHQTDMLSPSNFDDNCFEYIDAEGNLFVFALTIGRTILKYATIKTTEVHIPSFFLDAEDVKHYVTAISGFAFCKQQQLKHLILPEGIIEIEDSAFADCGSLLTIFIPSSTKYIGSMLRKCPTFEENAGGIIYYPGTKEQWHQLIDSYPMRRLMDYTPYYEVVRFVDNRAPFQLPEMDFQTLRDEDTEAEISYLRYCETGDEITIPAYYVNSKGERKDITHIGRSSFASNTKIKKVIIPSTVQEIGIDAFYRCENLQEVVILKADTELLVGMGAFFECKNLKTISTGRECRWGKFALGDVTADIIQTS